LLIPVNVIEHTTSQQATDVTPHASFDIVLSHYCGET